MKKIISLTVASICTLSLSGPALGATKEQSLKCYIPSFCENVYSCEELAKNLSECIEKLKAEGYLCTVELPDIDCGGADTPVIPDKPDEPVIPETPEEPVVPDTPVVPEKPELPDNGESTPPAAEEDNNIASPSSQTAEEAALAAKVVELVNKERTSRGLNPLSQNLSVQTAAQVRSREQVELFSHTRPNGSSCFTVLSENGVSYKGAGENIAYGQKTAEAVVDAWMNSDGHRANILSGNFTDIGVGCYISPNSTIYWTQLFIY